MRSTTAHSTYQLPGKPKKPLDLLGFVQRYGIIVAIGGLFVMTMLVPVVLKVARPDFEVKASLKIDPVVESLIAKSDDLSITSFYHDYVRTQARRIKEYTILEQAMAKLSDSQRMEVFQRQLSPVETVTRLEKLLTITPITGTHLLELSLRGPNRRGLAPLLNAVVDTYLQMMEGELANKYERRLTYLAEKRQELGSSIGTKEEELRRIASAVFSSTFAEDYNISQKKAVELQDAYVKSFQQRVENENAFLAQKKQNEELRSLSLASVVDEAVMDNRAIDFTSSWTYQQLQNMRASIDGVTKENEDRKRVESRMVAMRDYEAKLRRETRDTLESVTYGKRELELKQELIRKENAFLQAKNTEETLSKALEIAKNESGENSSSLLHSKSLSTELDHDRDLLFRINTRLHELEAESRAPLRVTVESRALDPDTPAGSNVKKLLLACLVASFGSVAGFFLLLELLDNRLHSPADLTRALGQTPAWPISQGPAPGRFLDLLREHRNSAAAKAIRSLASRLFQDHQQHGSRVFLFTGVDKLSGTSEILLNTAEALTRHVGKVLVIDGHLAGGDLGRKLGAATAPADIQEVLSGRRPLSDCVYHDQTRAFDLVIFGASSPEQLTARDFTALLGLAREQYDLVCLDSGPVMANDFTEFLAVNADVTVLVSLGDSTLYKDLRRTAEIFIGLGIPAMAAVLNWGGNKKKIWFDEYLDKIPSILGARFRMPMLSAGNKQGALT